jgi:glucosamine 6-phosphate synthetase-like amidotransferase/phosphosugar isomerase protein
MCGVGGIFFKTAEHGQKTGEIAYRILDGIFRRGPDSTGVTLWHANEGGLLYVGVNCEAPGGGARVLELLDRLGAVKQATDGDGYVRAAIQYDGTEDDLVSAIDALDPGISVGSVGRHLEVLKHMGGVANLDAAFDLKSYDGRLAMGLTRYATESRIDFTNGQPLTARANSDLSVVHNGHITNYHHLRSSYALKGYNFSTQNDSEVIPIMLIDEMSQGATFEEALHISIEKLDGCFTYIAVTGDRFALVKDAYAAKPQVVAENDDFVAMSSDPQSLREGVLSDMDVWEPGAGEVHVWQM